MFSTVDTDKEANLTSCICDNHIYNLFGVQQSRRVAVCKRSWECEGRMYDLHFMRLDVVGNLP